MKAVVEPGEKPKWAKKNNPGLVQNLRRALKQKLKAGVSTFGSGV